MGKRAVHATTNHCIVDDATQLATRIAHQLFQGYLFSCTLYFRNLSKSAVQIQRCWRGFMGRTYCRIRIRNLVMIMGMNLHNAMAVRIQKRWRGFYVRKYVHNFHARKRYLEGLIIKNQIVRSELDEFREQQLSEYKRNQQIAHEKKLQFEARKNHYLVSTHQIAGIYNSPFREFPQEMEFRLRAAKPLSHRKVIPVQDDFSGMVDVASLPQKPGPSKATLPPLPEPIKGPFRTPAEVQAQRYKPLHPSVRVATDFECLEKARESIKQEEWRLRIHDTPFMPFSKRKAPYNPLLHTSTEYGHLPYGTKYFREEDKSRRISKERMRTLVSPIPIFEQFGRTFSKGSVVLQ